MTVLAFCMQNENRAGEHVKLKDINLELPTGGIMALTNIGLSLFMYWLSNIEDIKVHMDSSIPVWNKTALTLVTAELLFMFLVLVLTYFIQARKKDFL